MGRPPLKLKDPTLKTTIRLPTSLLQRMKEVAGDGDVAAFIRRAVERELERATEAAPRKPKSPNP